MKDRLVIHLKNGDTVDGRLSGALGSNSEDVEIFADVENRVLLFALDEICAISFVGTPGWLAADEPTVLEEVQILTGETFMVKVCTKRQFLKGFMSILLDETLPYKSIFFTFSGVRTRNEARCIGEILQEEGLVNDDSVHEVLKTQETLRQRRIGDAIAETANLSQDTIESTIQDATANSGTPRDARVGDILVEAGLVTREQVEKAFESQEKGKKIKVGELLVKHGLISEEQLLSALATKFRLRFLDLDTILPSEEALGVLSEGLVNRLQVFPVEFDGRRLVVATSAPTDPTVGDSLRFSTNYRIELVVATAGQISGSIEKYYHREKSEIDTLLKAMKEEAQSVTIEEEGEETQVLEPDSEVIALINRILLDAYRRGASDIHFEPGSGKNPVSVRYRIDGDCMVAHKISSTFKSAIISRIKIISGLDISERRRPQSGKILLRFEQRKIEYRVEITPIVGGHEAVVLRLLSASKPLPLSEMGLMPYNLDRFRGLLEKPYGIILCVGPTGSGKTTTLHSALGQINTPTRKIWTAEDPVEITQPGLCQVQVNAKIGFSFPEALRSFLRADPDVIMIGEMCDAETAKIAIEASLTGHLVFSTLHTNSAPETVVRLIDMGMDPFNFADAFLGIIAQRLAKRLCVKCRMSVQPSREEYDALLEDFRHDAGHVSDLIPTFEDSTVMLKQGCDQCGGSGYKGRVAIHELMLGSPAVKSAIREGRSVDELRRLALADGMWTLKMDGIMKVFAGLTDMEHIHKVCI